MEVFDLTPVFLDDMESRARAARSAADKERLIGKFHARLERHSSAKAAYDRATALLADALRIENLIARTKLETRK